MEVTEGTEVRSVVWIGRFRARARAQVADPARAPRHHDDAVQEDRATDPRASPEAPPQETPGRPPSV